MTMRRYFRRWRNWWRMHPRWRDRKRSDLAVEAITPGKIAADAITTAKLSASVIGG